MAKVVATKTVPVQRVTCPQCHATVEFDPETEKFGKAKVRDWPDDADLTAHPTIICPGCGETILLELRHIPYRLRANYHK